MRWKILFVLFVARTSMALQFGAIGPIAPVYEQTFLVSTAALGGLIGFYFLPALVISLPGGALGARFGDKQVVVFGLVLMVLGGMIATFATDWNMQIAARVLAGAGGVLLNVLMTKMVADWFTGKEIATAMAIFINSWPAGIATGLIALPFLAEMGGLYAAAGFVTACAALGLVLVVFLYESPGAKLPGEAAKGVFPKGYALLAITAAGLAWGLFNASFGIVYSFGPLNLVERGVSLAQASATTSIVIFCVIFFGIIGGAIADRIRDQNILFYLATPVMFAATLWFPHSNSIYLTLILLGAATGLPAGLYVTLATKGLRPQERAIGMGVFFTIYYAVFAISPWTAGKFIDLRGESAAAFEYAAAILVLTLVAIALCIHWQNRRWAADARA